MKLSNYVLFFVFIFLCLFGVASYVIEMQSVAGIMETKYANALTAACHDAVKTADCNTVEIGVFDSENKREKAIDVFFQSLFLSFNTEGTKKEELPLYVPVICVIDKNGYYLSYTANYTDEYGPAIKRVITPLNTWSTQSSDGVYTVQFNLNNDVSVCDRTSGTIVEGDAIDVYKKLNKPAVLNFLDYSVSDFETIKKQTIIQKTNAEIEYYINQHNFVGKQYGIQYRFTMPETKEEDWARALQGPTVLAFMQGKIVNSADTTLNIYSLAGGEIKKMKYVYYIDRETNTYHRSDCSFITKRMKRKSYTSATECAKKGAYPCEHCNP